MTLPLTFRDLAVWLAVMSLILLFTIEVTAPRFGLLTLTIDRTHLHHVTYLLTLLFLFTITVLTIQILV